MFIPWIHGYKNTTCSNKFYISTFKGKSTSDIITHKVFNELYIDKILT